MPRQRSPERQKAFEIYKESGGKIQNREIANILGISEKTIGGWKCKDNWAQLRNGVLPKKKVKKKRSTPKKHGAPKGNKNAKGNPGGAAPTGNKNAERHGFFAKIFPDDPETLDIIRTIDIKSPIDILWENITIQYTAIARAQKIMFVKDKDDLTKVLKREKSGSQFDEKEWELQHAWDKQASFLQAQSRAMSTLQGMITKYEDLLLKELATEEQKMRISKLKAEVAKINNTGNQDTADWLTALQQIATRRRAQVSADE